MKAIDINGEIKTYNELPQSWEGVIGNFSMLSEDEIKDYGFYDVIIPDYDSRIEVKSEIYWDSENEVFTYDISDKVLSNTLQELKDIRITELKFVIHTKLTKTDWYITRKSERNIAIPADIISEREDIINSYETNKTNINNLTTKKEVVVYEFE